MAKGKARGLPWYFDTWFSHTDHLSDSAYRAYHRLIGFMWEHGDNQSEILDKPSALARATRLNGQALKDAMNEIMDADGPLLIRRGKKLKSKRLRQEHDKYKARSDAGRKSADARWKKCERNANAMRTHDFVNAAEAEAEAIANSPCPSHSNDLDPAQKYLKDHSVNVQAGEKGPVGLMVDMICKVTGDMSYRQDGWRGKVAYVLLQPGGQRELDDILDRAQQPTVNSPKRYVAKHISALEREYRDAQESNA